jgi:hypothetical protein
MVRCKTMTSAPSFSREAASRALGSMPPHRPTLTMIEAGTHSTSVSPASSARRCSVCPSPGLMSVGIRAVVTCLMKNYASDGINSLLSSLLLVTLRALKGLELNHSTSRLILTKLRRPCMIGCNILDFCTLACSR